MSALTIVLTGACGGIGKALAVAFSGAGHNLVLIGSNAEALAALRDGLPRPRSHRYLVADLSSAADIIELCADIADGPAIDVLVNNAGVSNFGLLSDTDDATMEKMLQLNMLAPMRLCRELMPLLLKSQSATVINIGSGFGSIGFAGFAAYSASKFGLRGFTEAMQREYANEKIAIHYLAPRAVKTAMNSDKVVAMNADLGNAADDPEVVASAAIALLQQRKSSNRYLGWPERFFVRLNALFPSIVSSALKKQLSTILSYAKSS